MADEKNSKIDQEITTGELAQSDPKKKPFVPENLDRTVIAIPLLNDLKAEDKEREKKPDIPRRVYKVIIDLNLEFRGRKESEGEGGRKEARKWVVDAVRNPLETIR